MYTSVTLILLTSIHRNLMKKLRKTNVWANQSSYCSFSPAELILLPKEEEFKSLQNDTV